MSASWPPGYRRLIGPFTWSLHKVIGKESAGQRTSCKRNSTESNTYVCAKHVCVCV